MSGKKVILLVIGSTLLIVLGGPYLVGEVILRPGARERGHLLACQTALIRLQRCLETYAREHEGHFPPDWEALQPYIQALDPEHPRQLCPAAGTPTYRRGYQVSPDQRSCTVVCRGQNHPGVPADFPRWSTREGLQER